MREVDVTSLLSVTQQKSSDQVPNLLRGFHCFLQTATSSLWPPSPKSGAAHCAYHCLPWRPQILKPHLNQFLADPAIATHNIELGV